MTTKDSAQPEHPQVFVTVGTDHHPFDRMTRWIDSWLEGAPAGADSFVQFGTSRPPAIASGEAYLSHPEMERRIAEARAIVCHGGPGTIIDCLRSGTKPIVIPRRSALGEHVDDHQVRFAQRLETAGYIKVASDEQELRALLEQALAGSPGFVARATEDSVRQTVDRFAELTAPLLRTTRDTDRVRVLYIGGWGRSGSTLLDRLLGQVTGCFSVGEMRDLWLRGVLENRRCGCGAPFHDCRFWAEVGSRAFGGWSEEQAHVLHGLRMRYDRPWTIPILADRKPRLPELERYVESTGAVYEAIRQVSGADVIIDSTKIPSYAFILRRLPGIDLRFVHLVRDSRGVVNSWARTVDRPDGTREQDRMIRYGTASASARYVLYNASAHLIRAAGVPYLFARYEDLASDPAPELERILSFGGLPTRVDFLEGGTADLQPDHTVDGNPMRFSEGPLVIRADEAWRSEMSIHDQRMVSALTWPLLRRYGYDTAA